MRVLDLSEASVFMMERGTIQPTLKAVRILSELLGWSDDEIGTLVLEMPDDPTRFYLPARTGSPDAQGESADQLAVPGR